MAETLEAVRTGDGQYETPVEQPTNASQVALAEKANPKKSTGKSAAKKRAGRPIYMVWRRVIDEATGELRMGLCADSGIDQFLCREREYRAGDVVRCEIKKARNIKFHRLVHTLGQKVAEHIDQFRGLDAHTTIKKLQLDAGVCCTYEAFDIPDLGRVMRLIPESIAFDEMPEERFKEFWRGICLHLIEKYWPDMTEEAIENMASMMPGEREQ